MSTVNDKVYTPLDIALNIIDRYHPRGRILDPCRGGGAFYDQYPAECIKEWCEIDEGRSFFDYDKKCDWIISNPPYSIFREWLNKSFDVADNVVYLIPIAKVVASKTIIKDISKYGGIVEINVMASGREIGFPFGFPCGSVYFKKDYDGETIMQTSSITGKTANTNGTIRY